MSRFVLRRVPTGIKFDLVAGNGQPLAASEVYRTLAACLRGVDSVRRNAGLAALEPEGERVNHPKFQIYRDRAGRFRFRLTARNGAVIAVSGGYALYRTCREAVERVRAQAPGAQTISAPCASEEKGV